MEGAVKMQGVLSSGAGTPKRTAATQKPSGTDDFLKLLQEKKDTTPPQENAKTRDVKRDNGKPEETSGKQKDDSDVEEPAEGEASGKQEALQQAVLAQQAALVFTVMPDAETVPESAAQVVGLTETAAVEALGEDVIADAAGMKDDVAEEMPAATESGFTGRMDVTEQTVKPAEERTTEDTQRTAEIRLEGVAEENRTTEPEKGTVKQSDRKPVTTERTSEEPEGMGGAQEAAYHVQSLRTTVREESAAPVERGTAEVPLKTTEPNLPEDLGKTLAARLPEAGRTLTVELEPASLGKLTIRLVYEGDRAAVSIMANNPRTLELLSQRASEIAAILEEKTGQETVIYTQPPEQNQDQPQDGRQGQGGQENREDRQRNHEKDRQQTDSFAQQLRLGLI